MKIESQNRLFVILFILFSHFLPMYAWQQWAGCDFEVDGIYYKITSSNTCGVSSNVYGGCYDTKKITIPDKVSYNDVTYDVTSIVADAFWDCRKIEEVLLPNSISAIEANAFKDCINLQSINLHDNIVNIGAYAFLRCSSLKSIYLGTNMIEIGHEAFNGCCSINEITIPRNIKELGYSVFVNCDNLKVVNYNAIDCNSATAIFGSSWSIEELNIGDEVYRIPEHVFMGLYNVISIRIPNSVLTIGDKAFFECLKLCELYIGYNLSYIGIDNFIGDFNLKKIAITAITPPQCNGNVFEDEIYSQCELVISGHNPDLYYSSTPWNNFQNINICSITDCYIDFNKNFPVYDLKGIYKGNNIKSLPTGYYIINGIKTFKP